VGLLVTSVSMMLFNGVFSSTRASKISAYNQSH
jgi:hypothetical protein